MARYIATIQQGHHTENHKDELTAGLTGIATELLGDDPSDARVSWKEIPRGWGFTAGELSSTSVVVCIVPDELPFETRLQLMTQVNEFWVNTTGIDANNLAVFTSATQL